MDEERKTPVERLQDVNMAIEKILLGWQSYQIGSRKLTRGDLAILRQMQKELQAEVAAEMIHRFLMTHMWRFFREDKEVQLCHG